MPKLNVDKHATSKALTDKLRLRFGSGKERNGWYELDGRKILRVTMPKGRGPLPTGTANSIRNQVKLTVEEFGDLLQCPLSGTDYEAIVRTKMDTGRL
ncbi:MAG: hypothetical protein NTW86_05170 [Candidatus Sumerlaeota bacterium]|nr:hypothetical protein [Candidatus Sumerlaeota bacterium]